MIYRTELGACYAIVGDDMIPISLEQAEILDAVGGANAYKDAREAEAPYTAVSTLLRVARGDEHDGRMLKYTPVVDAVWYNGIDIRMDFVSVDVPSAHRFRAVSAGGITMRTNGDLVRVGCGDGMARPVDLIVRQGAWSTVSTVDPAWRDSAGFSALIRLLTYLSPRCTWAPDLAPGEKVDFDKSLLIKNASREICWADSPESALPAQVQAALDLIGIAELPDQVWESIRFRSRKGRI